MNAITRILDWPAAPLEDNPLVLWDADKAGILAAMERRLANDRETEVATALEQIGEIVRLRLKDMT